MKVLATYSIKGGVGKTSAAVNLAAEAAARGWRVLLWDLDPQGAATYLFRVSTRVKGGARALVNRTRTLADATRATDVANLDIVPADFRYRHLDLLLAKSKRPARRLAGVMEASGDDYDWVILDCAPSVSLVSEGVLAVTDGLLVPVVPSTLSVRTVDQLLGFLREIDGKRTGPEVIGFFSMVDRRKRLHREVVDRLPLERPGLLAAAQIPNASVVERMGLERAPLRSFAPHTKAAKEYADLWVEIEHRWPDP